MLAAAYALPEALKKDVKGLITRLENVADLSVLQTDSGIDVAGIINGGGCLYVIGSMDDEAVIRVQKCCLPAARKSSLRGTSSGSGHTSA
ncbi:hypothetical protein [Klebsiella pneumoniae]|uniref:hypothetical protein n=1 Tax=Klebsiella pneumoniae TaxID=573 RepID=UPI0022CE2367|nr:hypothetical protein [Klebsiella pneumoniae]